MSGPRLRLVAIEAPRLPPWCDALLPPGDFFQSRTWWDAVLAAGLPPGGRAVLGMDDAAGVALPLLRGRWGYAGLSTPYTLGWRPLGGADARAAGHGLAHRLRWAAPLRLDALDPGEAATASLLEGAAAAGLRVLRFAHFGNWRAALPAGTGWAGFLRSRPGALRSTIRRKDTARLALAVLDAPGPALEAGIGAFAAVRERSWKPPEPSPDFDAAVMRAAAASGALRLGILRRADDGAPVAAQYWVLDAPGGMRRATLPKLFHSEDHRDMSPGTVLTARMLERLLDRDGVRELDLGRGDDPYKRLWVEERRQREGALLVSPRHPAGWLALARRAASRLRGAAR